jgi:hypothetical protein
MDLSKFKVKDSITVEIVHPDLGDAHVSFEIAGPSHALTLKSQRERADRITKLRGRNMTAKEKEALGIEMLASRVLSWEGVEWEGKPLECTPENAAMILGNPNLGFIANQVFTVLAEDDSFFSA